MGCGKGLPCLRANMWRNKIALKTGAIQAAFHFQGQLDLLMLLRCSAALLTKSPGMISRLRVSIPHLIDSRPSPNSVTQF